ncbi:MAG: outer membrane protein assembly factor BamD [Candidatus Eisenbacteria sp.]|nr:outer membrane protein assembly factor BamD [Candidatus Eisenbacteria bacterium]
MRSGKAGVLLRVLPWLILGMFSVCGWSCGGSSPQVRLDPRDQLVLSKHDFERKKYMKVIPDFQVLTFNYPGTAEGMEAQFLLAESYRLSKQFDLAREAYQDLIRDYPQSPRREEAQFKIGVAYLEESLPAEYDQELTWKALEEFDVFLAEFPDSPILEQARQAMNECREKMAEKDYKNGNLYLKMGYTEAARRTFERVIEEYPTTRSAPPAFLGMARAYLKEKKREEAVPFLDRLIKEYPGTPEARAAQERLGEIEGVSREQG